METTPTPSNIQIVWDFDLPNPDDMTAHDAFAEANGIPTIVDLNDYFEDPDAVCNDQITDALSDEHGWLVLDWDKLDACNNDNTDGMINQQPQPINPLEDNMENATTPTNNNEVPMSSSDLITQIFNQFIDEGGSPKVTEFKRHIDQLIKSDIKQLCGRVAKSADGNDWRSVLKAKFGGRGAKWVKLPVNKIEATLDKFDNDGIDTSDYREFINKEGYAWIRFSGPRIDNGVQAAAFEVRTKGSTIDHPKQLHYIPTAELDNVIEPLGGTPHSKKLEAVAKPEEVEANEVDETETQVATDAEVEANEPTAEMLDAMIADINNFDDDEVEDDLFAAV